VTKDARYHQPDYREPINEMRDKVIGGRQFGKTQQMKEFALKAVMKGKTVAIIRGKETIVVKLSDKELAEAKKVLP